MRHGRWPGTWKAQCDVCGFWFPSSDMRERWDNLMVCEKDWEIKQPQLEIRIPPDKQNPPWVRPNADYLAYTCYIYAISAYAGLGEAGCMKAGVQQFPYAYLYNLKYNSGNSYL